MQIFIAGGVKGGKSMLAQCIAKYLSDRDATQLYYLATMIPHDSEDNKRIERHLMDRADWGFETVEEGTDVRRICPMLDKNSVVLMDSITAYVQNNIFTSDKGMVKADSGDMAKSVEILSDTVKHTVIVSDYIFSDALIYDEWTDFYRSSLGKVHAAIAKSSDVVIECAYSTIKFWKNSDELDFPVILDKYYSCKTHLQYHDI